MMNDSSDNSILNSIKISNPLPTSGFSGWPDYSANNTFFNWNNVGQYLTLQNILIMILVLILLYYGLSSLGGSFFPEKQEDIFTSTQETSSNNSFIVVVIFVLIGFFAIGYLYYSNYDINYLIGLAPSTITPSTTSSTTTTKSGSLPTKGFTLPTLASSSSSSNADNSILSYLQYAHLLGGNTSSTVTPGPNSVTVPASTNAYTEIAKHSNPNNSTLQEITTKHQVFNIPGNSYNYENAKAVCAAYGSRLATYSEIEDAYKNGGEWCNYGWSDGQMALFPTQESTYNQYQKIEGHENDCGRPGVNGGYMDNPELQFGVNCYGYKPKMNEQESYLMQYKSPFPKSKEELESQQRVSYWKNKINDILVSPFNNNIWSEV